MPGPGFYCSITTALSFTQPRFTSPVFSEMFQESGTSSILSNLEIQLADVMTVIQMLMANVGNVTQQVVHLTQNMAYMQDAKIVPQPSPQPSPHHFPLPPSPQQQPLSHLSLFALSQDHAVPMPSSSRVKEPKTANLFSFLEKGMTQSHSSMAAVYISTAGNQSFQQKIYWILSYMQTGSAKTWHDYVVALMFKGQQSVTTSDELLKEIN